MATHSSILAWEIPWTEDPGGLQPMQLQRVRQDLATNTQFDIKIALWNKFMHVLHFRESPLKHINGSADI